MVTGKSLAHYPMASIAMRCFLSQSYPAKQLVIVNDGPVRLSVNDSRCTEVYLQEKKSLGELRNIGLEAAEGDWVIQWDDDDYHHRDRMAYQMSQRQEGRCQLLTHQLRCNMRTGVTYRFHEPVGIAGTILHPKTEHRYPDQKKGEDGVFWLEGWGMKGRQLLLSRDKPEVYLRFYHGHNTWDEGHIMRGLGKQEDVPPEATPTVDQFNYVDRVLQAYGKRPTRLV